MKEEYNRLFEKAAPRMSDEELLKSVLSGGKEHNMENNKNTTPKKRKIAPMIAAVAATAALATTAGAVIYNRSINEVYNNVLAQDAEVFPQEYTDKDGNALEQKDAAFKSGMYEKLNIEINKTFECDGFTFEVPGAISDGEELLIMYNVFFDEDPFAREVLWEEPWFYEDENIYLQVTDNYDEVVAYTRLGQGIVSEYEGKKVYSSYFNLRGIDSCTYPLKVTFEYLWGSRADGGKRNRYINADIEIPISQDFTKFNKTVDIPDEPYVKLGSAGNWNLLQLEATPLGASFSMKTDEEMPDDDYYFVCSHRIPIYVNFKDGSSLDATSTNAWRDDAENKTLWLKTSFNYPIDVDEIQSIQFVNAQVNMEDGSVTTVDAPEVPFFYLEGNEWVEVEE